MERARGMTSFVSCRWNKRRRLVGGDASTKVRSRGGKDDLPFHGQTVATRARRSVPRGLTLTELLVVVSIVVVVSATLVSLVQPVLRGQQVREAARELNVYLAAVYDGFFILLAFALLNMLTGIYYYLRPLIQIWTDSSSSSPKPHPVAIGVKLYVLVSAGVVFVLGVAPEFLMTLTKRVALELF